MSDRIYPRPDRRLVLAEPGRALSELGALISSAPFLSLAPRGDGHGVLVMPGFGASDRSTTLLRGYLRRLGHAAQPWTLGRNFGPAIADLPAALAERLDDLYVDSGRRKVSLVGWSLGGVYARLLAHLYPHKVRQVITLGSPFAGHPKSTSIYPMVRRMNIPYRQPTTRDLRALAAQALPDIPSSAVFSKTDGVVPWQIATQVPSPIAENIEVFSSHLGLGFNPAVFYAVADRLAQSEEQWQPFERRGWKLALFGPAILGPNDFTQGRREAAS